MTGENTPETFLGALAEMREICQDAGCWRLLIENRLAGEALDRQQVFEVIREQSPNAVGLFSAIAYVGEGRDIEVARYGEDVAVDRGVPLMVFPTVSEAAEWILWRPEDMLAPENPETE